MSDDIDKMFYHLMYLTFIEDLYESSDKIDNVDKFQKKVKELLENINTTIKEIRKKLDESADDDKSDLTSKIQKNIQEKLKKIKNISEKESYTYEIPKKPTGDGGGGVLKRKQKTLSNKKQKKLSNKRRLSGRGSHRRRDVISRRRR